MIGAQTHYVPLIFLAMLNAQQEMVFRQSKITHHTAFDESLLWKRLRAAPFCELTHIGSAAQALYPGPSVRIPAMRRGKGRSWREVQP